MVFVRQLPPRDAFLSLNDDSIVQLGRSLRDHPQGELPIPQGISLSQEALGWLRNLTARERVDLGNGWADDRTPAYLTQEELGDFRIMGGNAIRNNIQLGSYVTLNRMRYGSLTDSDDPILEKIAVALGGRESQAYIQLVLDVHRFMDRNSPTYDPSFQIHYTTAGSRVVRFDYSYVSNPNDETKLRYIVPIFQENLLWLPRVLPLEFTGRTDPHEIVVFPYETDTYTTSRTPLTLLPLDASHSLAAYSTSRAIGSLNVNVIVRLFATSLRSRQLTSGLTSTLNQYLLEHPQPVSVDFTEGFREHREMPIGSRMAEELDRHYTSYRCGGTSYRDELNLRAGTNVSYNQILLSQRNSLNVPENDIVICTNSSNSADDQCFIGFNHRDADVGYDLPVSHASSVALGALLGIDTMPYVFPNRVRRWLVRESDEERARLIVLRGRLSVYYPPQHDYPAQYRGADINIFDTNPCSHSFAITTPTPTRSIIEEDNRIRSTASDSCFASTHGALLCGNLLPRVATGVSVRDPWPTWNASLGVATRLLINTGGRRGLFPITPWADLGFGAGMRIGESFFYGQIALGASLVNEERERPYSLLNAGFLLSYDSMDQLLMGAVLDFVPASRYFPGIRIQYQRGLDSEAAQAVFLGAIFESQALNVLIH